ncbi:hypothetical protein CfE428DRAFT_0154 [Chthoniobacter flavus Ellin428]|uniref:Uncharacterized protein n=2 Tax=Chthoniobacter flavus TaxID=191863 RepID=B4CTZ1_9BACT|nr:hypothetical protein CfE428DRAFT_0154 [Chthoniobacter flavus Ellin428]TCO89416.1 hypothetical protein EV701_114150 [Chthoniobacter flavus]
MAWSLLVASPCPQALSVGADRIPAAARAVSFTGPTADAASRIIIPRLDFREATLGEALDFLRKKAEELSPNRSLFNLVLNLPPDARPPRLTLELKDVSLLDAARSIAALVNLELTLEQNAFVFGVAPPKVKMAKPSAAWKKAEALSIPQLELRQATTLEAVEFLQKKSAELDPGKRGVNLLLQPGPENFARMSMSLRGISLAEALRYVAGAAEMELMAQPDRIVLQPRKERAVKPPKMVAASVRREGSVILAEDHAVLNGEGLTIVADEIRYDTATARAQASGHVEIWHGAELTQGDDLQLGLGPRGQFVVEGALRSTVVWPFSNLEGASEPERTDIMTTFLRGLTLRGEGDVQGAAWQFERALEKLDGVKMSDASDQRILKEFRAIIMDKQKGL